jgi:5-methylcytosine-specific restriction endonuclease McrA
MAEQFAADAAMSLSDERDSKSWWAGWKRHYWPADMLRRGFRCYTYDKQSRTLFELVEVVRGRSFTYRTLDEFARKVRQLIGRSPNRDNAYWRGLPRPRKRRPCTGYAIDWKTVRSVNIPWHGRFPQLGWARLSGKPLIPDIDPLQSFAEGDREVHRHLAIERDSKLRALAKDYWRVKLGRLQCLACGFDFEKRYGLIGAEFIEMHHDVPLSLRKGRRRTKVKDLKPLCSNCHRMVHRDVKNPLSLVALKRMLRLTTARTPTRARAARAGGAER